MYPSSLFKICILGLVAAGCTSISQLPEAPETVFPIAQPPVLEVVEPDFDVPVRMTALPHPDSEQLRDALSDPVLEAKPEDAPESEVTAESDVELVAVPEVTPVLETESESEPISDMAAELSPEPVLDEPSSDGELISESESESESEPELDFPEPEQESAPEPIISNSWATKIRSISSSGSGFFVDKRGYVLTAAHVIAGCQTINLRTPDNWLVQARPAVIDVARDLALLQSRPIWQSAAVFTRDTVRDAQKAFVAGFPRGQDYKFVPVNVDHAVYEPGQGMIGLSGDVQLGNSGGALVSQDGYILGVIKSKVDTLRHLKRTGELKVEKGLAIDVKQVQNFLLRAGIKPQFSGGLLDASHPPAKLENVIVRVGCKK